MVFKGISQDDFSGEWGWETVQRIISNEDHYCSGSSPTHSPRRVVPYFTDSFGSVSSKATRIVSKMMFFSCMA